MEGGVDRQLPGHRQRSLDRTRAEGYAHSCPRYPGKYTGVTRGRAGEVKEVRGREKNERMPGRREGDLTSNGCTTWSTTKRIISPTPSGCAMTWMN